MNEPARDDDARSLAMLQQSFVNLGATAESAHVMAVQLLKRARQIAKERGISESAALGELLAKVVAGRKGEYAAQSSVHSADDATDIRSPGQSHPSE